MAAAQNPEVGADAWAQVRMVTSNRSKHVYVYNTTRETFLATEVKVADGYFSRLIGLLGKTRRWSRAGRGLWIVPSHGVHTIGMMFSIDLVFLDHARRVVHIEEYVRPFRISAVSLKASSVLELPPHTIFRTGTQVGDDLEVGRLGSATDDFMTGRRTQLREQHVTSSGGKAEQASSASPFLG